VVGLPLIWTSDNEKITFVGLVSLVRTSENEKNIRLAKDGRNEKQKLGFNSKVVISDRKENENKVSHFGD